MYKRDCFQDILHTPSKVQKNKKARVNSPLNLSWNRMYVHWRDREHEEIDILVNEELISFTALKQCGFQKLYQFQFMRAQPRLLNSLEDY